MQLQCVGGIGVIRRNADIQQEAFPRLGDDLRRGRPASADVDGRGGQEFRLVRRLLQVWNLHQILIANHCQQQGEYWNGQCWSQPGKPSRFRWSTSYCRYRYWSLAQ